MQRAVAELEALVRKFDNVEFKDKFYRVEDIRFSSIVKGLGSVAAGTFATPTEGAKVEISESKTDRLGELVWVFIGVRPVRASAVIGTANTESVNIPPATAPTVGDLEISQFVRAYVGKEVAAWLTPNGDIIGNIDHRTSPDDNPSYMSSLILQRGETPYLQAVNPYPVAFEQFVRLYMYVLKVSELPSKPERFTTLPHFVFKRNA